MDVCTAVTGLLGFAHMDTIIMIIAVAVIPVGIVCWAWYLWRKKVAAWEGDIATNKKKGKEGNPSSQHSVEKQLELMSRNLEKIADNTKGIRTDITILIIVFVLIPIIVKGCEISG